MKTREELVGRVFAILAELESGTVYGRVADKLEVKLEFLYNEVLDEEDIPEEYWDRIERQIG